MHRIFLIALVAALLGVGLLAGCGGDDDNGGGGSDTKTESKQQDTTQTDSTDEGADTETQPEDQGSQGGSEGEFDEQFAEVNDDVRALGEKVGTAVNSARGKSDAALATQFTALGEETEELKTRLDELQPPEDLAALRDRLSKALGVVASDLSGIGQAAEDNDAGEARKQATELVRHSVEVRDARRALARKTGAKV